MMAQDARAPIEAMDVASASSSPRPAAFNTTTTTTTTTTSGSREFEDLDAMDFLRVGTTRDKSGRPTVMLISRNFRPTGVPLERLQRYVLERCDKITDAPYTLVWIHTCATYWSNCPSMWWLWRTYQQLPAKYCNNLAAAYVVHCDLSLWACSLLMMPFLTGDLWKKITWVNRLEFLWDDVHKTDVPAFVKEHDAELEEQPLTDYGVVASKEALATVAAPQGCI